MGEHEQSGLLRNVVVIGIVSMVGMIVIFAAIGLRLNMSTATSTATSNVAQNIKNANEDPNVITDEEDTSNYYYDEPDQTNKTITISGVRDSSKITGTVIVPSYAIYSGKKYTVVGINSYAYSVNKNITNVVIPDTIKSIGNYAFYSDSKLTSVTIGSSVETISESAFAYSNLESVVLPDSVKTIGGSAFAFISANKDGFASIGKNTSYVKDISNASFGTHWVGPSGSMYQTSYTPIVRS